MIKSNRRHQLFVRFLFGACLVVAAVLMASGQPTRAEQAGQGRGPATQSQPAQPAQAAQPAQTLTSVGTNFTYQGRLKNGSSPANGPYDFQFKLYDALSVGTQIGSTLTQLNQTVTDGLFTVQLDFGTSAFQGDARWLEIAVRQVGGGSYTTLSPRQPLTAAPYASSLMPGAGISGTVSGPTLSITNTFTGTNATGVKGESTNGYGVYGTSSSLSGVYGFSSGNIGVLGQSNNQHGGLFTTNSTTGYAALQGIANGTPGYGIYGEGNSIGVWGTTLNGTGVRGATTGGYGVHGYSVSNGTGVRGESPSGYGVYGISSNNNGVRSESSAAGVAGVYGSGNVGGYGVEGHGGNGVYGITSVSNGVGVRGDSQSGYGVYGVVTSGSGVRGESSSGAGVYGVSDSSSGVIGNTNTGAGVYGYGAGASSTGVYGYSTASNSTGVYGQGTVTGVQGSGGTYGVHASGTYIGIYGTGSDYAGYFSGDVRVTGSCCAAAAGSFKIDHPLDPGNKYLVQSAVESDDLMSVYNGNATTDAKGEAVVTLPTYVEALNKDFRYQLTILGDEFAQARVSSKIKANHFTIKTDKPKIEVSWQVTGTRNDPYAQAHPIEVEVNKSKEERGRYLHPEVYGQPESKGIDYERNQQSDQQHLEARPEDQKLQTPGPEHNR